MKAFRANGLAASAVVMLFLVASCSEKSATLGPGPNFSALTAPARIEIDPPVDTLNAIGYTTQLTAVVYDSSDVVLTDPVTWSSSHPARATVVNGLVTSSGRGFARIIGRSGGVRDTSFIVLRQIVKTITVTPALDSVPSGNTVQLSVTAVDSNDVAVDGAKVTWRSANKSIATVDANGLVTTHAGGAVRITARYAGDGVISSEVGEARIVATYDTSYFKISPPNDTIRAIGYTRQMTTPPLTTSGGDPVAVTWTSLNRRVITIDPVTGIATAVQAGVSQIVASAGINVDTVNLWVKRYEAIMEVTPTTASIAVGATEALTGVVKDSGGTVMDRHVFWFTRDSAIATVAPGGVVTGIGPGTVYIIARHGADAVDSAEVTVNDVDGTTHSWATGVAGDWADATKWSPGFVPAVTDTANIDETGSAVTLAVNTTIGQLTMATGTTLGLSGFELTVELDLLVDDGASVSGGTVVLSNQGVMSGDLPAVRMTGGRRLTASSKLSGPLNIQDGSLSIADGALSIAIP